MASRTKKAPEERRAEIVSAARDLFMSKGLEATSVSDIVKAIGVAQGTFYWYFKTKDDVLVAVVEEVVEEICRNIVDIVDNPKVGALDKLEMIKKSLFDRPYASSELMERFHEPGNMQLHNRLAAEMIKILVPAFARLFREGNEEGVFDVPYPEEFASMLLAASEVFHVELLHGMDESERVRRAFESFIGKALGVS